MSLGASSIRPMKHCRKCQTDKPLPAFSRDRTTGDGLNAMCRVCTAARDRERRARDPKAWKREAAARQRAWRDRNPKRNLVRQKSYRAKWKREVLVAYGGDPPRCSCCGETNPGFLTLDHIDGAGNEHRRSIGGGSHLNLWLRRQGFPEGFQVLCFNCNAGRYWNGGDCPHQAMSSTTRTF